jgi:hypothetical protein
MTMSDQEQTTEIEALYIEELGEVRGGIELPFVRPILPISLGIAGAEGIDPRPWNPPGFQPEPREPRFPFPLPPPEAFEER